MRSRSVNEEKLDVAVEFCAELVEYVQEMGHSVKHVSIKSTNLSKTNNFQLFRTVMNSCSQLYALMLDSFSTCSTIRDLRLYDYDHDHTLRSIQNTQTLQLTTLIVPGRHFISGAILDILSPSSLRVLQVRLSHGLSADELIENLSPTCNVEALCLDTDEAEQLGNEALLSRLQLCPQLQHLDFYCPYQFIGNIVCSN